MAKKKETPAATNTGVPVREKLKEVAALFFVLCAMFVLIALVTYDPGDIAGIKYPANSPAANKAGTIGAHLAYALLANFGLSAYLVVFLTGFWAVSLFFRRRFDGLWIKLSAAIVALLAGATFLSIQPLADASTFGLAGTAPGAGGVYGKALELLLVQNLGFAGTYLAVILAFCISIVLATDWMIYIAVGKAAAFAWAAIGRTMKKSDEAEKLDEEQARQEITLAVTAERQKLADALADLPAEPETEIALPEPVVVEREPITEPRIDMKQMSRLDTIKLPANPAEREIEDDEPIFKRVKAEKTIAPRAESMHNVIKTMAAAHERPKQIPYEQPSIDIFDKPVSNGAGMKESEIQERMAIIENTLAEYDITTKCVNYEVGPATTTFELELAPGTTCASLAARADELTMKLAVPPVRVVAPIPNKSTVGIEVPNPVAEVVRMRPFLEKGYSDLRKIPLPMVLGKTNSGEPIIKSLAAMPHLLIGGSTGSGKSVCLNTIITTLVCTMSWDEMKLILIDPKKVELAPFADIPHLWAPVVDDAAQAAKVLEWLVKEMEERYAQLKSVGARNIDGYNKLGEKGIRERLAEAGAPPEEIETAATFMPYIVVVIDEMANLMQTARKEVELTISTLAAKARAIGIHMICATQRPSADVITGLIKANMPSRIGFRVSSAMESRIILDNKGADRLLGRGDMLTLMAPTYTLQRGQCTFTSDEEIREVVKFLKSKAKPVYHQELIELNTIAEGEGTANDERFDEAVEVVLEEQKASTSWLQRRMAIGYSRAARLMETMEAWGIVGKGNGAARRDILVTFEQWGAMKRKKAEEVATSS